MVSRANPQTWRLARHLADISGSDRHHVWTWNRDAISRYQIENQNYWYDKAKELTRLLSDGAFVGPDSEKD